MGSPLERIVIDRIHFVKSIIHVIPLYINNLEQTLQIVGSLLAVSSIWRVCSKEIQAPLYTVLPGRSQRQRRSRTDHAMVIGLPRRPQLQYATKIDARLEMNTKDKRNDGWRTPAGKKANLSLAISAHVPARRRRRHFFYSRVGRLPELRGPQGQPSTTPRPDQ